MSRRGDKKGVGKFAKMLGIGGIGCPCCTLGPKQVTKYYWNRTDRRRVARDLAKTVKDEVDTAE